MKYLTNKIKLLNTNSNRIHTIAMNKKGTKIYNIDEN